MYTSVLVDCASLYLADVVQQCCHTYYQQVRVVVYIRVVEFFQHFDGVLPNSAEMIVVLCHLIRLDCEDELVSYYERHGFEIIGKNQDDDLNQMIAVI